VGDALKPGVRVSWTDALGNQRFGTIDEIDENGRVYVAEARINRRGRSVISSCWFDAHETDRLIRGAMEKAEPTEGAEKP
jgi:hypothetical protein